LIIVIIAIVIGIIQIKTEVAALKNQTLQKDKAKPAIKYPTKKADLEITDNGFSNTGLSFFGNDKLVLNIKNSGTKPHSFVVNELQINSGDIAPGQIKEIKIDALPNVSALYRYYSNSGDDTKETFNGSIILLKR
jgi:hypothetical protein